MLWPETPEETHRAEMREMLAWPELWAVFVAIGPESQLAGFVEVSLREDPESIKRHRIGYLEGWFVDPAYRRQGVGRGLVRAAEGWVRGQGCTVMDSDAEVMDETSHRAHAALGYREVERQVRFRKILIP